MARGLIFLSLPAVKLEDGVFPAFGATEGKILVQDSRFFTFSGVPVAGSELCRDLFFSAMVNPICSSGR
jgi:hypothetical protein